jgi:mannosyltransferase
MLRKAAPRGSVRAHLLAVVVPTMLSLCLSVLTVDRRALWRDEMATWEFSRLPFVDLVHATRHVDAVLAPYYALMHVWQSAFPSAVALRVPSLLAAAGTVAVIAAVAVRLWNAWAGFVAGCALALNGAFADTAVSARPYALAMCCCAVATYLLVCARDSPGSRRLWAWYAVACCLAVLFQVLTVFVLVAHLVPAFVWFRRRALLRFLLASGVTCLVTGLVLLAAARQHGQLLWAQGRPALYALRVTVAATGESRPWHGWLLLVCAGIGLVVALVRRDSGWLLGPSLLVVPAVGLFMLSGLWHPAFVQRYLMLAPLGAALVIGSAVAGFRPAALGVFALVAAVTVANWPALQKHFSSASVDDFPALVSLLDRHVAPGDWVVVGQDYASGGVAAGFAYYSGDGAFRSAVVAALPHGSPTLSPRHVTSHSPPTSTGVPHGRTWLIGLVRWWVGESEPYGTTQLEAWGCVRDTAQPEVHKNGYGLVLMRCR